MITPVTGHAHLSLQRLGGGWGEAPTKLPMASPTKIPWILVRLRILHESAWYKKNGTLIHANNTRISQLLPQTKISFLDRSLPLHSDMYNPGPCMIVPF